jgi:hypothetical protein
MRKLIEQHIAKLREARHAPEEADALRDLLFERMYPPAAARLRPARQAAIPRHAPDWYFESELRRSGLWAMMERCYPTSSAQSQ